MRVGGAFSGIGAFEKGLQDSGMEIVWMCESDPECRKVLEHHWPGVPVYTDAWTICDENPEQIDLLCGGFPCQPFSSASRGRKRGIADDRWLWPAMLEMVRFFRPSYVLPENVPHLDDGVALEQMVSDLEGLGYSVGEPLEIPACAVGCDHWRARLWLFGHSDRNREPVSPVDGKVAKLPESRDDAGGVGAAYGTARGVDRPDGITKRTDEGVG